MLPAGGGLGFFVRWDKWGVGMKWAEPPESRTQTVIFAQSLDQTLPDDHVVRALDSILHSKHVNWAPWEALYHDHIGQPAIYPRVLVGVIVYGLLCRVRASRALEEALRVRLDFRWLAEGRRIDHTTISIFRRKHLGLTKDLMVQVCQAAREMGVLSLERLAFDGTRVRANNRRSGSRTPAELRKERDDLQRRCQELLEQAATEDAKEDEEFALGSPHKLPPELIDLQQRQQQADRALEQLAQIEEQGLTTPKRLPITDCESRIMPNKEGGFAPNYTPTATVDVASGMIVDVTVLAQHNEDAQLVPSLLAVQEAFGLERPSPEMLADGLNGTGANLAQLEELGVTLYSPCEIPDSQKNPALRDDPTQPVSPEDWSRLPTFATKCKTADGERRRQLEKSAFVYDAERDCYWCPQGMALKYAATTTEKSGTGKRIRRRYQADATACAVCPLRDLCMQPSVKARQVNREQYSAQQERHAQRMATPEAQTIYQQRRHPGERPFAVIKQQFGVRQFLLRGLQRVKAEWTWAATAFNIDRLIGLQRSRAGPEPEPSRTS
jgi:transposase